MAKKRNSETGFMGTVVKVFVLCMGITGSAVGYVWQKGEIVRLGQQIHQHEQELNQLNRDNQRMSDKIAILRSPVMLDQSVRKLNLGLGPSQPGQVVRLMEPAVATAPRSGLRQVAERAGYAMTP